jgi:hypothetical protein
MRFAWLSLVVIAACSFDRSGPGAHAVGDDGGPGVADAPANHPADAPPGTPDAKPGIPDATPPGPPDASPNAGITCGNMTCSGQNVCCVSFQNGGGQMGYECKDKCDGNQGTFACDGPEDCPGQHCCVGRTSSACADDCGFDSTACRTPSDCGGNDDCCKTQYPNLNLCGFVCF